MNQTSDVLPQDQGSPSDIWAPGYEFLIGNRGQARGSSNPRK